MSKSDPKTFSQENLAEQLEYDEDVQRYEADSYEKATVITNFEDYVLQDSFNEDEVEHRFLKSKPSCFLIIGKPGVGKTIIAKKLAEDFKAELISGKYISVRDVFFIHFKIS